MPTPEGCWVGVLYTLTRSVRALSLNVEVESLCHVLMSSRVSVGQLQVNVFVMRFGAPFLRHLYVLRLSRVMLCSCHQPGVTLGRHPSLLRISTETSPRKSAFLVPLISAVYFVSATTGTDPSG
nr:uncharacterized protein LOC129382128 [Dermacentor andersoni]